MCIGAWKNCKTLHTFLRDSLHACRLQVCFSFHRQEIYITSQRYVINSSRVTDTAIFQTSFICRLKRFKCKYKHQQQSMLQLSEVCNCYNRIVIICSVWGTTCYIQTYTLVACVRYKNHNFFCCESNATIQIHGLFSLPTEFT